MGLKARTSTTEMTFSAHGEHSFTTRQDIPPQVMLVYKGVIRSYGRERLLGLSYKEVQCIFHRDFGARLQEAHNDRFMSVNFYRTHGQGDRGCPTTIDKESWDELLRNVTRIELAHLDDSIPFWFFVKIVFAFCLLLCIVLLMLIACRPNREDRRMFNATRRNEYERAQKVFFEQNMPILYV